jgi:D-tyrosyl-tRNA(Tyr) deacylase
MVDDELIGAIGRGFLLLVGITHTDSEAEVATMTKKIANLRVFPDEAGAMNRSALDLLGEGAGTPAMIAVDQRTAPVAMLVVSQFTLYADTKKGRRPSFIHAARPEQAEPLVNLLSQSLFELGIPMATGSFGAHMAVELLNDGPVTIILDTDDWK